VIVIAAVPLLNAEQRTRKFVMAPAANL